MNKMALLLDPDNNVLVVDSDDKTHAQFLVDQDIVKLPDGTKEVDQGDSTWQEYVLDEVLDKDYIRARNWGMHAGKNQIMIDHRREGILKPEIIFKILKELNALYNHRIFEQNPSRPKAFDGTYKDYLEWYESQRKFKNIANALTNMRDYL